MHSGTRAAHLERVHRRIEELLPWHVNGTLAPDESRAVETHLSECGLCRATLAADQALAASVRADASSSPPAPHPRSAARLLARLDDEGQLAAERPRLAVLETYRSTPAAVRVLVLAQLAAILVLLVGLAQRTAVPLALGQPAPPEPASYRTLAEREPAVDDRRTLRVIFAATATEAEIREVLAAIRGQIVAGPSPLGAYRVAVPSSGDPVSVVLAHLRSQGSVMFAEPVAGEPSPAAP